MIDKLIALYEQQITDLENGLLRYQNEMQRIEAELVGRRDTLLLKRGRLEQLQEDLARFQQYKAENPA